MAVSCGQFRGKALSKAADMAKRVAEEYEQAEMEEARLKAENAATSANGRQ